MNDILVYFLYFSLVGSKNGLIRFFSYSALSLQPIVYSGHSMQSLPSGDELREFPTKPISH